MKIGSLCSGYGGLDLAVESLFGASLEWYSEFDKNPAKIMAHHYPDHTNYGDLTKIDWAEMPSIDILTAGYPCQPFSHAGQRKGTNDPRHIWPNIAEAIRILRPSLAIFENVRGHLTLGFDTVLGQIADLGYDAQWSIVKAADVGAPHRRERLFIIAYPNSQTHKQPQRTNRTISGQRATQFDWPDWKIAGGSCSHDSNTCCLGCLGAGIRQEQHQRQSQSGIGNMGAFDWQQYTAAIRKWENTTNRSAPEPIDNQRLNPRFVEWMMGLPDGWVTDIDIPYNAQIKALGNGVVPQQAYHAIKGLIERI